MVAFEPSDQAIAVLVEIARTGGRDLNAGQRLELDRLLSQGLATMVANEQGQRSYDVTPKGQDVLDQRGVGANEA